MVYVVDPDAHLNTSITRTHYTLHIHHLLPEGCPYHMKSHLLQLPGCTAIDVSSQLCLQYHLLWSRSHLGYLAFTIFANISLALSGTRGDEEERGLGD